MKILNVGHNYHVSGGSDRVLIETGELLANNGHTVIPFCAQNKKNFNSAYSNFFPRSIDFDKISIRSLLSFFYNFEAKSSLNSLLESQSLAIDIAHLHIYYGKLTTSVLHSLKAHKVPIVQSLHEYKLACPIYTMELNGNVCDKCIKGNKVHCVLNKCKNSSYLQSTVMATESYISRILGDVRNVDLFLSVSEFHKTIMLKAGIPNEKLKVLHNFVDTDKYKAECTHQNHFLYFGRIEKLKGLDTLISAFEKSKHKLKIIGGGAYLSEVLKRISTIKNIEYEGFKQGKELMNYISNATAVIVPSEWYENCPMNVLEAKALGRPVIGSDIGGIPELIRNNIDGYVFEPGNVDKLTECIDKVTNKFTEMSILAREDAVSRFSKVAYLEKLLAFYDLARSTKGE